MIANDKAAKEQFIKHKQEMMKKGNTSIEELLQEAYDKVYYSHICKWIIDRWGHYDMVYTPYNQHVLREWEEDNK